MKLLLLTVLFCGTSFANPIHKYHQKSFSQQKVFTLSDADRVKCISAMKKEGGLDSKNKNPGNMFFISDDKCREILSK